MATFIQGIGASENIDSSGEVVSIAGLDISSLDKDGVFNYEHKSDIPAQVVGKILKARKIFSDADCEDDHQLYFWNKCKVPYLYVMGELFDDYSDSAREIAGRFRYDADHKNTNERNVMNFSVEGSKISKEGITVSRSIARKITITVLACNKAAVAEMVAVDPKNPKKSEVDELFKTESVEIEIFTPGANWNLLKKEDPKKHADKLGIKPFQKDMAGGQASNGASTGLSGVGPTSAGGLMVDSEKNAGAPMKKMFQPDKGVHQSAATYDKKSGTITDKKAGKPHGTSLAGTHARDAHTMKSPALASQNLASAKKQHTKVLGELQSQPKPNLPKSEEMNKAANLSVAKDHQRGGKIGMTSSGKEVYSHGMVGDYKGFSAKDHQEASKHHQQLAGKLSATDNKAGVHHSQKATLHLQASKSAERRIKGTHGNPASSAGTVSKPSSPIPAPGPDSAKPSFRKGVASENMMNKALTAGSGLAGPANLVEGAAISGKVKKKSKMLQRAELEYVTWTKREEFESFMKSRMPTLTRAEIQVIGQTMLLHKALKKDFYNPATLKSEIADPTEGAAKEVRGALESLPQRLKSIK